MRKLNIKYLLTYLFCITSCVVQAADRFIDFRHAEQNWALFTADNRSLEILSDVSENKGVALAIKNLQTDFNAVTGFIPALVDKAGRNCRIIIGTHGTSQWIGRLEKNGKIKAEDLKGKTEKFLITTLIDPLPELSGRVLVIAGSDRRGTIYGIYELSRQMGVSPWYWWADVPVEEHPDIYVRTGTYTDGEPAVKYRGIFLNDEWPAMGGWATEKFGGFNSQMYVHVFELLLRLKANFLWPAMWNAAFYADDSLNSPLADEMGIIVGTSHHEPMARNHQEWARNRQQYGEWNYRTNQSTVDQFFREGIERIKGKEDVVTVAMRGDGDEPMGPNTDTKLLEKIVDNQRKIIQEITRKPAEKTPQVWALYSEVLEYYDKGMKIPDDVMILLCDDNWGDVRRLPDLNAKPHPGGYGMYYHVDLHGAPRAYQWINMTQIQHMWEQLQLTYDYGVDKMWILNVGDLKPMEFPMDFFLKMAWNPKQFTANNLTKYTQAFCAEQFGEGQSAEAARILNLYTKYAARVSAEMLDSHTYNLQSGEFKSVRDEFLVLEAYALRQYAVLDESYRDAYFELVLYPVQAMANLYDLYYAVAMNRQAASENDRLANYSWAEWAEKCFERDSVLSDFYNHKVAGGKWNHMMDQVHIGYSSWDAPARNLMPPVCRLDPQAKIEGGFAFRERNGVVVMEAQHYYKAVPSGQTAWTVIPDLGRTLSGVALMPYNQSVDGASLSYRMTLLSNLHKVKVRLIVDSSLPFNVTGHRVAVSMDQGERQVINFNNEHDWAHCYTKMYPAGAARVIELEYVFDLKETQGNEHILTVQPLDAGVVFQKIVVDCGGYEPTRLFMSESPKEFCK